MIVVDYDIVAPAYERRYDRDRFDDLRSTSQLMVISGAEYEAGLQRMIEEQPVLRAELRLFATIGRLPKIKN